MQGLCEGLRLPNLERASVYHTCKPFYMHKNISKHTSETLHKSRPKQFSLTSW